MSGECFPVSHDPFSISRDDGGSDSVPTPEAVGKSVIVICLAQVATFPCCIVWTQGKEGNRYTRESASLSEF